MSDKQLTLKSPDFNDGDTLPNAQVFNDFGCTGENQSPALSWENAPEGTKSFAISVYDPDAPTGSGFWHWLVINIPADTHSLASNAGALHSGSLPKGAFTLRNDYGYRGFGGACPPEGDQPHRYQFNIYALDTDHIALPEDATTAFAGFMLHSHIIGKAQITAFYGR